MHTKALTYGGDMLYNANAVNGGTNPGIVKWKKFANSLTVAFTAYGYQNAMGD